MSVTVAVCISVSGVGTRMRFGYPGLLSTNPGPVMCMVSSEWLATAGTHDGQGHVTSLAGGAEDGRSIFPMWNSLYGVHINVRSSRHGVDPFIPHPSFPSIISK